jgi:hypothetical protein
MKSKRDASYLPEGYTEPHLVTLKFLQENKEFPDEIRSLAINMYKLNRAFLNQLLGNLELAWRRGYQAGKEDKS